MNKRIALFYIIWAALGAMQAYAMELADDEAYYWVCGQYLDWGSYHTPPLIPFLSKIGYALVHNEFGVRLFYWVTHMLTLLLIERLTKPKDSKLFLVILSSFLVIHVAGFWAVPDIPFLFFTALLVFLFDRYAKRPSVLNALLLAAGMALLIYSKYHAAVVIVALILANTELFKQPTFYLAGILCTVFLLPHIYWLWEHDFITITFHWQARDHHGYNWYYPFHYIMSLLLISGPLIGLLLIPSSLKFKPKDQKEKNLKYVLVGFLSFFFLLSFRNRIEANWMVAVIIPVMILGYYQAEKSARLRKWIYYIFPISLILALACRLCLTVDLLPKERKIFSKLSEFHGNKVWVQKLEKETGDLPVVFQYSHQLPSKYMFYSRQKEVANIAPHTSLSSNFQILHLENRFHGKQINMIHAIPSAGYREVKTQRSNFFIKEVDTFCALGDLTIITTPPANLHVGDSALIPIYIPNFEEIDFNCPATAQTKISYYFSNHNDYVVSEISGVKLIDLKASQGKHSLNVRLPDKAGTYFLSVALINEHLIPTHNSKRSPVKILD